MVRIFLTLKTIPSRLTLNHLTEPLLPLQQPPVMRLVTLGQYAQGYTAMKVRSALVPVVNFTSNTWIFIFLIGVVLNLAGLVNLAIIFYAFAVLFQVVTLPVEFDASKRALAYMGSTGLPETERIGSWNVLRACALTYVAAALVSVLQLLYLIGAREE